MTKKTKDPLIGKRIGGFRILSLRGEGAMGKVYKAEQISLEREVALKILPNRLAKKQPDFLDRFLREAKLAAQISHPNIVQVHEAGEYKGISYIAQEFVRGSSLADIIIRRGPMAENQAYSIVLQAAQGLLAGEKLNMVHRDIKPDNLLLTLDGIVKVADFGLAKSSGSDSMITQASQILGTPAFMSPEQARSLPVDQRSDMYSLGATLYQMLTGTVPFRGENPLTTLMMHMEKPVPNPRDVLEDLSDFAVELVQKMMAKDPKDRFQSFGDLIAILVKKRGVLGNSGVGEDGEAGERPATNLAMLYPTAETLPTWDSPRRKTWLLLPALIACAAVVGAVLWGAGAFNSAPASPSTAGAPAGIRLVVIEPADGAHLASGDVEVKGSAENASTLMVNGMEADWDGTSFALRIHLEREGAHIIRVEARAPDGKMEKEIKVQVDLTAPVLSLSRVRAGETLPTNQDIFPVEGHMEEDHPKRLAVNDCSVPFDDNGAFSTDVEVKTEGETPVDIVAFDRAGNRTSFSFSLVMDKVAPEVTLVSPAEAYGRPLQRIALRFSEPVRGVRIAGTPVEADAKGLYVLAQKLIKGTNEVYVGAADLAGNTISQVLTIHYARFHPQRLKEEESAWAVLLGRLLRPGERTDRIDALQAFLKTFREGKYEKQARVRLDRFLDERRADDEAFAKAKALALGPSPPREKLKALKAYKDRFGGHDVKAMVAAIHKTALPLTAAGVELATEKGFFRNVRDDSRLVFVPAGSYVFVRSAEDTTAVTCRLSGYYIAVHEVTNRQFARFLMDLQQDMDEQGRPFVYNSLTEKGGAFPWGLTRQKGRWVPVSGFENHPVIFVTWFGAVKYAAWAGGFLPTEAQWERAAAGTQGRPFPWGEEAPGEKHGNLGRKTPSTTAVGSYPAGRSPAGCLDMAGNVLEWCRDAYSRDYLKSVGHRKDPLNRTGGERTLRGGSWFHPMEFAKTACRRVHLSPKGRFPTTGFRCVVQGGRK
jgi:formylglycine-generating enzyme required for sulfatase activity